MRRLACNHPRPVRPRPRNPTSMPWWSAPVSPACTCSTSCACRACACACSRRGRTSAAPGIGTAIPARAATWRASTTPIRSRPESNRPGPGASASRARPILRYLDFVAARLNLRRDIQFDARVAGAEYDESARLWTVRAAGATLTTRYLVLAVGCLSAANVPDIAGLDDFQGRWLHTGRWPREGVDLRGKRVGVIGTGSSASSSFPPSRPRSRNSTCSSARQASACRRATRRSAPSSSTTWRATRRAGRATASRPPAILDPNFESALDVTPEQRELDRGALAQGRRRLPGGLQGSAGQCRRQRHRCAVRSRQDSRAGARSRPPPRRWCRATSP